MTTIAKLAYRAERFGPAIAMRNAREQAEAAIEATIARFAETPGDAQFLRQQFGVVAACSHIVRVDAVKASLVAQRIAI